MERFHLAPLPYAYDALSPFISEETLRLHHDNHTCSLEKGVEIVDVMQAQAI